MGCEVKVLNSEDYVLLDKGETILCPYAHCGGYVRKIIYEKKCKELGRELSEYYCNKDPLNHKFEKNC